LKCHEKTPCQTRFFIEEYIIDPADAGRTMKSVNAFMREHTISKLMIEEPRKQPNAFMEK